jgi:hypothetical protein
MGLSRRRQVLVFGALGLVVIVAAAAVLVPLSMPHATGTSPEPSAVAQVSDQPTSSPTSPSDAPSATVWPSSSPARPSSLDMETPQPTESPSPEPTSEMPTEDPNWEVNPPPVANGWPVVWRPRHSFVIQGLPSGAVHLSYTWVEDQDMHWGLEIDTSGKSHPTFLVRPDGRFADPAAFGSDGTIYAVDWSDTTSKLVYAFGPDGSARSGWPVAVDDFSMLAGPSGTLYAVRNGELVILGSDGRVRGASSGATQRACLNDAVVRPDGSMVSICTDDAGQTTRLSVFDAEAQLVSSEPTNWQSLTMGGDGMVVAYRYAEGPSLSLAVLGANGHAASGWPITVDGLVSSPVIGEDGTIYLVSSATASAPGKLMALLPNAETKAGWPFSLPAGRQTMVDGCNEPLPPADLLLGRDGTAYLTVDQGETQYVYAVGTDGKTRTGWPVKLPSPMTAVFFQVDEGMVACDVIGHAYALLVQPSSGPARLYVHTQSEILALGTDGRTIPGWPRKGDFGYWQVMPDGGLVTLELEINQSNEEKTITLHRWLPDGSLAK